MQYLIHTCNNREWYVTNYLIPSMTAQGIDKNSIAIYQDKNNDGNLESCMKSFAQCESDEVTWHLQDDVIISRNFKEVTESIQDDFVCAFCSDWDRDINAIGKVKTESMWHSFQCIKLPNFIARECAEWFYREARECKKYLPHIINKNNDDGMFRIFMELHYPDYSILNLKPNLVEHIDYLIGGSQINHFRHLPIRAKYFNDMDLIIDLTNKLKEKKNATV